MYRYLLKYPYFIYEYSVLVWVLSKGLTLVLQILSRRKILVIHIHTRTYLSSLVILNLNLNWPLHEICYCKFGVVIAITEVSHIAMHVDMTEWVPVQAQGDLISPVHVLTYTSQHQACCQHQHQQQPSSFPAIPHLTWHPPHRPPPTPAPHQSPSREECRKCQGNPQRGMPCQLSSR